MTTKAMIIAQSAFWHDSNSEDIFTVQCYSSLLSGYPSHLLVIAFLDLAVYPPEAALYPEARNMGIMI
jgi:hypothetical protein